MAASDTYAIFSSRYYSAVAEVLYKKLMNEMYHRMRFEACAAAVEYVGA